MKATFALPYRIGKYAVMVKVSPRGLIFWKRGKREKVYIGWDRVLPWTAVYVGDSDDPPQLSTPSIGGEEDE